MMKPHFFESAWFSGIKPMRERQSMCVNWMRVRLCSGRQLSLVANNGLNFHWRRCMSWIIIYGCTCHKGIDRQTLKELRQSPQTRAGRAPSSSTRTQWKRNAFQNKKIGGISDNFHRDWKWFRNVGYSEAIRSCGLTLAPPSSIIQHTQNIKSTVLQFPKVRTGGQKPNEKFWKSTNFPKNYEWRKVSVAKSEH